jgi:hypothetical protein
MGELCARRKPSAPGTVRSCAALSGEASLRGVSEMAEEKEVIVTDSGGGGGGVLIAVVLLLAVIVVLFLLFGRGLMNGNNPTDINADVKIETPAKTN